MTIPLPYPSLAAFDLIDIVRLIRSENVGTITFFGLVRQFRTPGHALRAIPDLARSGGRKKPITICTREAAEQEIEATLKFGGSFIRYGEPDYPALLHSIYDPPPLLTVKGDRTLLSRKTMLAIVGARNASANGYHFAQKMARDAGAQGWCVVSGLARGIDTGAHKGSLETGTIAVVASGIDHIYPPENKDLYHSLAEKGLIVTEHAFGMAPHARSFPSRNRIISGMSAGVLVVEASLKSGSLITARCAGEQGRELFAVPGSPLDPRCKGTNELLKNGAVLTESIEDIIQQMRAPALPLLREAEADGFQEATAEIPSPEMLEKSRLLVAEKLSPHPVLVDELLQQCHITPPVLSLLLLEMELAGTLQRHPGNRVSLRIVD